MCLLKIPQCFVQTWSFSNVYCTHCTNLKKNTIWDSWVVCSSARILNVVRSSARFYNSYIRGIMSPLPKEDILVFVDFLFFLFFFGQILSGPWIKHPLRSECKTLNMESWHQREVQCIKKNWPWPKFTISISNYNKIVQIITFESTLNLDQRKVTSREGSLQKKILTQIYRLKVKF